MSVQPSHAGLYGVSSLQIQVGCVIFRLKCPAVPSWLEAVEVEMEASGVGVEVVQPAAGVWLSDKQQVRKSLVAHLGAFLVHIFKLSLL